MDYAHPQQPSDNGRPRLIFGKGNAKLGRNIHTFSLPAGHSCPGAKQCLAKVNEKMGKLTDGLRSEFRCFAASQEVVFPSVRRARWANLRTLSNLTPEAASEAIRESLPKSAKLVRIHVSGDFFSQGYFDAWLAVARSLPAVTFYAYTKSLRFWVARLGQIPANLRLIASRGGTHDYLIDAHHLRCAEVVFTPEDAEARGLEIDHDDSHAYEGTTSFALLIHGIQRAGSPASKAIQILNQRGVEYGYSK